jgi:hypothetical protein
VITGVVFQNKEWCYDLASLPISCCVFLIFCIFQSCVWRNARPEIPLRCLSSFSSSVHVLHTIWTDYRWWSAVKNCSFLATCSVYFFREVVFSILHFPFLLLSCTLYIFLITWIQFFWSPFFVGLHPRKYPSTF